MKLLITGGAGLIGSNLVRLMLRSGTYKLERQGTLKTSDALKS